MTSQTDMQMDTDESVKARLVRAADEEMRLQGTASVTMAAVADRAGVSRATAFRQLGGTSKMIIQVGLYRARHHIERARQIVDAQPDILSKLEDLKVYTTRALPDDPVIVALMAQRSTAILDEDIRAVTEELSGPILLAGQAAGVVRNDVPIRELIDFLVEQTYLAADYPDRSEQAARHRFRTFISPALRPQPPTPAVPITNPSDQELESALANASDAIASARDAAARLRLRSEMNFGRYTDG